MTDTEKLNKLVEYIQGAERYHLDMANKGSVENGIKSQAIQDITLFMEHELGISQISWWNSKFISFKLDTEGSMI